MRFGHAAALALVGWYLMIAPLTKDGTARNNSAPLSSWRVTLSFDTATACQNSIVEFWARLSRDKQQAFSDSTRCIASDDPRLKGN
jgi:hypothetical protein